MTSKKELKEEIRHLEHINHEQDKENNTLYAQLSELRQQLNESRLAHRETCQLYEYEKGKRMDLADDLESVEESLTRAHARISEVSILGALEATMSSYRPGCKYELLLKSVPIYDLYITETANFGDDRHFIKRFYDYDEALAFTRELKGDDEE